MPEQQTLKVILSIDVIVKNADVRDRGSGWLRGGGVSDAVSIT